MRGGRLGTAPAGSTAASLISPLTDIGMIP
jgi:hypothetical protein